MGLVIGIDFDNTIIEYDELLFHLAVERRLISPGACKSKKHIRDAIRALPDGDIEWQQLQAIMYGPAIGKAVLAEGVADFIGVCRRRGATVRIVSHKTARSNLGGSAVNFREAATEWMSERGFFQPDGLGFDSSDVWYESTREAKVERIAALGCTHFIDDLEEVFRERTFPAAIAKILYNPHAEAVTVGGVRVCANWDQVGASVFS